MQICPCFFYDIIIYSLDWETQLLHLHTVLKVLVHKQLYDKLNKCEFGVAKMAYIGNIILEEGVATNSSKVQAIVD